MRAGGEDEKEDYVRGGERNDKTKDREKRRREGREDSMLVHYTMFGRG